VVEVVEQMGDFVFWENCQQLKDVVDRGARPMMGLGRHFGRGKAKVM
jgi:hypothetical protein